MRKSIDFPMGLKNIRQVRGLSQEELSTLAGLHRTHISLLELGKRSPSFVTIEKIANAFDMPTSEFVKILESM
jgi:transcriptional regulator with XRE-family HTH domain